MSGFIALLHTDGRPVDGPLLTQLTQTMNRRGPDGQSIRQLGPLGMGHTLLHTVDDCPPTPQPFTLDEKVWIVADARLDDRTTLRAKLRAAHPEIHAQTGDVELLLRAYLQWGEACLDHIIGDFGFVIWDSRTQRLFAAHDHFGVVPVYYARLAHTLLVGNTRQAILQHPLVTGSLAPQTIADYLLLGMNHDITATFYAEIRRLAPGQKLTCHAGEFQIASYWDYTPPARLLRYRRDEEYIEHFRILFTAAVEDRVRTHAVATHLSGGLDSSSIAVTSNRLLRTRGQSFDLRAYTYHYASLIPDDEHILAEKIAQHSNIALEHLVIEDYLFRPADMQPAYRVPEPSPIANQLAEYEVARRAMSFSRVLLTGFGGDPLLNETFFPLRGKRVDDWGVALLWAFRGARTTGIRPRLGLRQSLPRAWGGKPRQMPETPLPVWLHPDFIAQLDLPARLDHLSQQMRGNQAGMANAPLWSNLFAAADPGYSGIPLKLCHPFFDRRLFDFAIAIPPAPWLRAKYLLRRAMEDHLPDVILRRRKTPLQGNTVPRLMEHLATATWVQEVLTAADLDAYIDRSRLQSSLRRHATLSHAESRQALSAILLAYWFYHRV